MSKLSLVCLVVLAFPLTVVAQSPRSDDRVARGPQGVKVAERYLESETAEKALQVVNLKRVDQAAMLAALLKMPVAVPDGFVESQFGEAGSASSAADFIFMKRSVVWWRPLASGR